MTPNSYIPTPTPTHSTRRKSTCRSVPAALVYQRIMTLLRHRATSGRRHELHGHYRQTPKDSSGSHRAMNWRPDERRSAPDQEFIDRQASPSAFLHTFGAADAEGSDDFAIRGNCIAGRERGTRDRPVGEHRHRTACERYEHSFTLFQQQRHRYCGVIVICRTSL